MLTKHELQTAVFLLRRGAASAQWASMLFFGVGDHNRAARLNELRDRLTDEATAIDGMIPAAPNQGGSA